MACLSTGVSGVPELIIDGETGLLDPPGDVQALAAALPRPSATSLATFSENFSELQATVGDSVANVARTSNTIWKSASKRPHSDLLRKLKSRAWRLAIPVGD